MRDWDAVPTVLFMSVSGALAAGITVGPVFVIGFLGDMDWDIVMESAKLSLLAFAVPFALYCLALLAAKPVGTLIGHTLMLFPAYRRWRQEQAMFEWWEEKLRTGLHVKVSVRNGNGEWRFVRSFDLGGPVPDSEVAPQRPPEEPVMDNKSELETLTVPEAK
jgi:hypothetical protein